MFINALQSSTGIAIWTENEKGKFSLVIILLWYGALHWLFAQIFKVAIDCMRLNSSGSIFLTRNSSLHYTIPYAAL